MEKTITKDNSKFLLVSKWLLVLSTFIIPFVFYPNSIHFFANLKLGLFFGVVILVLLLWSISRLKNDSFKFPNNLLYLSIVLVLFTSLISSIFSDNPIVSIFGVMLSLNSFFGILILFVSSLLIASIFNNKKESFIFTISIYFSLVLTLLFNLLYVFLDFLPNLGFFLTNSINTVGKWSDLGVLSVLVIIISYLIIENKKEFDVLKKIAIVGVALSVIGALVVNETNLWILLGLVSIIYLVYKIADSRTNPSEFFNKNLPYTTISVILLSFVMILAGNFISNFTDQWLNINFEEIKPGVSSTFELTQKTLEQNVATGVGVNRFQRAWQLYKPEGINSTAYWGADFNFGYSYFSSIPAIVGLLGALAWVFFLVMLVWNIVKLLFKKIEDEISNKLNLIHVFSLITFILILSIHIPSVTILILFFVFLGLFIGSLQRNSLLQNSEIIMVDKPKLGFLFIFSVVVLMIFSIYMGYVATRQFVSTILLERAQYQLNLGNFEKTQNNLILSVNTFGSDVNFRALGDYYKIEIGRLLQNGNFQNQQTIDSFRNILLNSVSSINAAIAFDRNNYENYLALGNTYEELISLDVEGAYEQSVNAYNKALEVNPNNPGIYLSIARSAFKNGDNTTSREYISKALQMNPRFVDAAFLLSQIQVSEGNVEEAVKSIEASINIDPGNSNLYFQLGLLRYNQENFDGAIVAFERAVILNPIFSNAKYFLGLSYEKTGRTEDAIGQFEDLNYLNPNNSEVETILSDLKNGRVIFNESVEEIEESDELPLEETEQAE